LPQISLPLGAMQGYPLGLSLIAPRGADRGLIDWVAKELKVDAEVVGS
jgi:Asp-tRNA(Asn)/Glu-tRNA(Gln) amidotransferase A subunit family amidase